MVRERTLFNVGLLLGAILPSLDRHSRARAALDSLELALTGAFDAYQRAISAMTPHSAEHHELHACLRRAQSSLRVLSGDLEEGGCHLIASADEAARLHCALVLFHSLIDMTAGVVDFQPDIRFTITKDDAIKVFDGGGNERIYVLGKLFEACGKYGCRVLEAEFHMAREGSTAERVSERAVAQAMYQACCETLTTLLARVETVDEKWASSASRLATAFCAA